MLIQIEDQLGFGAIFGSISSGRGIPIELVTRSGSCAHPMDVRIIELISAESVVYKSIFFLSSAAFLLGKVDFSDWNYDQSEFYYLNREL